VLVHTFLVLESEGRDLPAAHLYAWGCFMPRKQIIDYTCRSVMRDESWKN
jgi:hypothetical protein